MNRTRVSVLAAGVVAAVMLTSCGVDRDALIDSIVKSTETKYGVTLDRSCVDGVISSYTDDQLDSKASEVGEAIYNDCIGGGSGEAPAEEAPAEEAPEEGS